MAQESGLAKRGLVVFGVLLLMAVTLGYMIFQRAAHNPRLQAVYAAAAKLTEHPNQVLRNEALKVRLAVNPK